MATKFKDGLISGDEIKSEGDIQAISGKSIIAVSTEAAKKITMHHDAAGGHISATQRLDINSPLLNLYMTDNLILSGDANETTLYHSNDGSVKLTTQAQGITVYGSDGVTAKKFKFPALAGGAAAAAGSTAATDYALIQAQKIGTAAGETSVFDFSLGDNKSNDKSARDEFRFRFKSAGINGNNEYSLMDIGALSNGVAILDLTVSHDQRDYDAVGESANSQIKAGKFIGEASLLAATVLPSTTTVNTQSSSTSAGQQLVILDDVAEAIVGMRISGEGIAAGTTIIHVNAVNHAITLSQNTSAVIPGDTNLTIETDFGKGLVNNTTDNLSEGTTNQYFTTSRARDTVSAANAAASGGGSLSYNATSGVFTYTPPVLSSYLTAVPASSITDAEVSATAGIALTKLATIAKSTILGNKDINTDKVPAALSASDVRTLINVAEGADAYGKWIASDGTTNKNIPASKKLIFKAHDANTIITLADEQTGNPLSGFTPTGNSIVTIQSKNDNTTYSAGNGLNLTGGSFNLAANQRLSDIVKVGNTKFYTEYGGNPDNNTNQGSHPTPETISWYHNNNEDMRLERFGTTSDVDLHVDGDIIAFSNTISDKRLKYDIKNVDDALSKIDKLNGVTFNWNRDDTLSAGVIAQEVEEVLPSAVKEKHLPLRKKSDNTLYKTVEYSQITALLIEAIKELKERVEDLESKL